MNSDATYEDLYKVKQLATLNWPQALFNIFNIIEIKGYITVSMVGVGESHGKERYTREHLHM